MIHTALGDDLFASSKMFFLTLACF